jgi:hypothetical protein
VDLALEDEYVIRLLAFANPRSIEGPDGALAASHLDRFLVRFHPGADRYEDQIVTTDDVDKAKGFRTAGEAMRVWRQDYGIRWDGQPNRPLTAYTVSVTRRRDAGLEGLL